MSQRGTLIGLLVAIAAGGLMSFVLGTLIGPAFGGGLVAGCVIGWRVAASTNLTPLARTLAGASAGVLGIVAAICRTLLVGNQSDNAYLWIALVAQAIFGPAGLFLLVSVVPRGAAARWLLRAAITLLWAVGLPGLLLLLVGPALYLGSTPMNLGFDTRVRLYHFIAAGLLGTSLFLCGYWWPRRMTGDQAT